MIKNKTISLCFVVYNDSDGVEKAINSVRSIVDEIVIVDQDSDKIHSDKFKSFADIYQRTTNKGNADPDRMFCYSLATKDYILALDSDEYITEENLKLFISLVEKYDKLDVCWMLFSNIIEYNGTKINLKEILGEDPHPRFWKKIINIDGQQVPPVIWRNEAHVHPIINTGNVVYGELYVNHERKLVDVIKRHLHRGKNIHPQAQAMEKQFINTLLLKFGESVKVQLKKEIPELIEYLKG